METERTEKESSGVIRKGHSKNHFSLRRLLLSKLDEQSGHSSTLKAGASEKLSSNYNCELSKSLHKRSPLAVCGTKMS